MYLASSSQRTFAMLSLPLLLAASASAASIASLAYGRLVLPFIDSWLPLAEPQQDMLGATDDVKVPVLLGVMSQCPDALLCEATMDKVLNQVGDKVDLSLSFIGTLNSSEPDFGVTCPHGATECAGDVQQLCASAYLEQKQWWSFIQCQNFEGRHQVGKPGVALKCADTAKFDWKDSGVAACASEDASGKAEEGVKLLQTSVAESDTLGIDRSCTILINGKAVCVHDGTWKECEDGHAVEDFVRQINAEYERLNLA